MEAEILLKDCTALSTGFLNSCCSFALSSSLACLSALDADRNTTLYVGDMAVDRDVARAAGLPVVLVSFGYAHADVSEFAPEAVLHHWHDWPDVCQRLADARTAEGL